MDRSISAGSTSREGDLVLLPERQYEIVELLVSRRGRVELGDLSSSLGLDPSALMRDLAELEAKGLLEVERDYRYRVELTEEGLRYVKLGLPEERLLRTLAETAELSLDALRKRPEDFGLAREEVPIAIQHLIKRRVISASGGVLRLAVGREEIADVLKELERDREKLKCLRGAEVEELEELRDFRKRGLLKIKRVARISVRPTARCLELFERGKVARGRLVTRLTPEIIETGEWRRVLFKKYDLTIEVPTVHPVRKHPYMELLDEIREVLEAMGFEEVRGPHVELELWNFDALFQAQDHPAREIHDTFYLRYPERGRFGDGELLERIGRTHEDGWITGSRGWRYKWDPERALRLILRTQTTAVSVRTIYERGEGEYRCFSLDRVFRPETLDPKHSMEFYQLEGIIVGRRVKFKHLLGFFREFADSLGLGEVKIKPAYFPFTEPSVEGFIRHPRLGWIEVFPGGMFRPEVLMPLGVEECNVAAWGIGIDRIAMFLLEVDDIRDLFSKDLQFLRRKPIPLIRSLYG